MTFTIIMIVCVAIVLGIAAMFGTAVSKGYDYEHTIDPLPEEPHHNHHKDEEDKKADANQ
ncbi:MULTISPECIES: YtzI protein [Halobacillus]|nr:MULTISPECIES: YtzI protein [Halobacillus]MCA1011170.1 YtzI protein [Halobacillus halophilus]SFF91604.1 Tumour necrosis factor receptor superfamily member 19 [Halobacillus alkaliphilus]